MTERSVQEELVKLTKLEPKKGEAADVFTKRVVDKVTKLADRDEENWRSLSEAAQTWHNDNMKALDQGKELASVLTLPDADEGEAQPEGEPEAAGAEEEKQDEEKKRPAERKAKKASAKKAVVAKPKKEAAKKAEPKAKKVKKEVGDRGRKPMFSDAGVIKVLAKENPHREGTIRDKAFKKLKTGMTVTEAIKAGCPRQQVWSLWKRKVVEIKEPRATA